MDISLYRTEPFRAIPGVLHLMLMLLILLMIFPVRWRLKKDQDHEHEYLPIASGVASFYDARVLELEVYEAGRRP